MSLEIQQREREGITVLEMKGRITVGKEATALREKVAELTAAGRATWSSTWPAWITSIAPAWARW